MSERSSFLCQCQERLEVGDAQALVVDDAGTPEETVLLWAVERPHGPAVPRRNNVHVVEQNERALSGRSSVEARVEVGAARRADQQSGRDPRSVQSIGEERRGPILTAGRVRSVDPEVAP